MTTITKKIPKNSKITSKINSSSNLKEDAIFSLSKHPSYGQVTLEPLTGIWIYEPNINFIGTDSFEIKIKDNLDNVIQTFIEVYRNVDYIS